MNSPAVASAPSAATSRRRRLVWCGLAVLVAVALCAGWAHHRWYGSLAILDGTRPLPGLGATVTVERDALGIPTIHATSRLDAMRALGWLHAQDRFFQMDLLRRRAAGELAELFGTRAVAHDRQVRRHDFRRFAAQAVPRLPAAQRELLAAYTAGVNAGLQALAAAPWEYAVLRTSAEPWQEEDSLLVGYAITLELQDAGRYERSVTTVRDVLGESAARFFAPTIAPDDAALDGSTAPLPPIPGPRALDLRAPPPAAEPTAALRPLAEPTAEADALCAGSNAMALAAPAAGAGPALLANDMHLGLAVPIVWYRAVLSWEQPNAGWIAGLTLPGSPGVIAGSNGHVAWGFTHCPADTADLVQVIPEPGADTLYRRQNDLARFETRRSTIRVKGGDDVELVTRWTDWGPIVGQGEMERLLALSWTAYSPAAIDFTLTEMDRARNVREAVAIAQRCGLPALNFLVADRSGAIAWTVAGRLPRRAGYEGRYPTSRLFGDRRWEGYLPPSDHPTLFSPASGWIASANERMWGGERWARLGDGGYDHPHRARQLQTGLAALAGRPAKPADLLALQLDDRALFLQRWRDLILRLLPASGSGPRAEFRRLVAAWDGRATIASHGHLLVREFRRLATQRVLDPIFATCREVNEEFSWRRFRYEPALWALLENRPQHLLSPAYATWDELLLSAVDEVIRDATAGGQALSAATWGEKNRARIQHPLAQGLPRWLGSLLSLPYAPLAGDSQLPRVALPAFGASERLVVAPGREAEGLCQMPGGQSGHPSSPFFSGTFAAWVQGEPTPFLPGPTRHTLRLTP